MSWKQHVVDLSDEERRTLEWFISTGEHRAEDITRARILLKADEVVTDLRICEHLDCSIATPYRARKNYCERGVAAIHRRKPDREYEIKLDGDAEARLIKLACSKPPKGHSHWTLNLLADELVMLDGIGSIRTLTKLSDSVYNALKPHLSSYWEIPPDQDADIVYCMGDVLALYHEPYDETPPVICFDESNKALRGHERDPLPAEPGAVARVDLRYDNDKKRLHITTEPLTGRVAVEVTDRRRKTE